jgi:hypothetical protein
MLESTVFLRLPELAGKRPLVIVGPDVSLQVRGFPKCSAAVVLQTTGMKPTRTVCENIAKLTTFLVGGGGGGCVE